ncbi:Arabinogalactan peptide 16 [Acorus calamus]|uniref:Arabinogalactan peptide 16 n=1 Tax=Acorus calamus TaxID=4465 RepID=A0AAV9EGS5_ACOCL|nr:Arabinogalactan peptide 16 [Acorus calamus]
MSQVRSISLFCIAFFFLVVFTHLGHCQVLEPPATSPMPPMNDGTTIDQGVAYVLMLVALLVTYLVH